MAVVCRTLDPEHLDYHIHFRWRFENDGPVFYISFHAGVVGKRENEREPYAERFMSWFGGFFGNETAHADIHCEFVYLTDTRQSRFPLPLKVTLSDDLEAEIGGIAVSFVSAPDEITGADIRQREKRLAIELSGTVRLNFVEFDLEREVNRLSCFALRLTDIRETK